ncbi:MAG: surface carbohydrate biosynthesis protein [Pseudodesulfovibrio sp.]|uniref:surface carbohydrate biosynthesis protein n=1 Tax=Pseudodesulfovibrio sp. TaxID=2035812 RepID=UPI003D0EB2F9
MLCAYQIETINRELDGILYLALHLAAKGLPMLIGDRMVGRYALDGEEPVVFFDKDQHRKTNERILNKGGVVLNINAEGQGFVDQPREMQANFAEVADCVTKICVWGERQRDILLGLVPEPLHDRLAVTGHPSFDLVSPTFVPYFLNESIRREHGENYLLINTSFALFNHQMGFDYYMRMLARMDEWKVYGTPEYLAHLKNRCAHQKRTALALIELAREAAARFPDRHVIVRPHPGEGEDFYRERLSGLPNVFITKQGSAREWIASAGAVIHHDCTTGMEATLMGKLVLQYEPYEGIEGSATLMTAIGHRVTTPDEALARIEQGSMPEDTRRELLGKLAPFLANVDGCAAEAIAGLAHGYAKGAKTRLPEPQGLLGQARCWRKYASKLLRARQPGRNGRKVRYALNKFSRLRGEEVERRIRGLRAAEPGLPEVAVKQLCLNTFLITPRD